MTPAQTIGHAAYLLQEDADATEGSCAVGENKWACPDCKTDADGKCQAQRSAEDRRRTAAKLLVLAKAL